jgi:DNA-binding SARP family transcriptional activator
VRLAIELLGQFQVAVDGRAIPVGDWRRGRSVALVKLLALAPGHRLHREQAMDALWPDMPVAAASANLRKAVHFARRAFGAHDAIMLDRDTVALAPNGQITIDTEIFEAEAKAALRSGDADACARAADRYPGDLLPDDRYVEWTEEARERLRQIYARVLKAGRLWERVLAFDPTDEEAQRSLMQAALNDGNRGEVIRQFQRLRERLRVDLGVGPAKATVEIYERALAGESVEPVSILDRVRALLAWGIIDLHSGDFANAERRAREARTLAFEAGLAREVGEASALFGMVAHMQGRWAELFRSEFVEWIREGPTFVAHVFDGHVCLAEFCLCGAGGHEDIANASRELLAIAEGAGSIPGRALATLILGEGELFSGRLDVAEQLLIDADRLHGQGGSTAGRVVCLQRLAEVALARGQKWRAGRLVQKGFRLAESTWLSPHLLIRLQALVVEAAATQARKADAIRQGDQWIAARNMCQPCSMAFRVASSIALSESGHVEEAGRRLDEAERLAGMWNGGPWVAAVWEARGAHRRAQGNEEQADGLFREAATRFNALGRTLDAERCLALVATH